MIPWLTLLLASSPALATQVQVQSDESGHRLMVDGEPYLVRGMNWGYMPIGQNYSYSLWVQDEAFIEAVLHREMALLQAAGVNTIRQYDDIPPEWVTWIYENYGITTMINPLFGRYGLNIDGAWVPVTDYSDPRTREVILEQTLASVERYKDVDGVLLILLGNENNYGLHWDSFEIQALPKEDQDQARARFLYSLYGEAVDLIHQTDSAHPVAIANGDLQYLDLVASEVPNLDIFGTNVYRGASARDLYQRVEDELGLPIVYTEFGADAFNAKTGQEDPITQARYVQSQWEDIYLNVAGSPGVGNAIGGYVFQWSDGWWKYKQEENLDVHDTNASWPNGGYAEDYVEGQNNMNEEWFGVCAKTPPDPSGHYTLQPRPAYYTLQAVWRMDPYGASSAAIEEHFDAIQPAEFMPLYESSQAAALAKELSRARVSELRMDWDTVAAGQNLGTPSIDHTESFYLGMEANPTQDIRADVTVNVLGNVADNMINEIAYETRGRDLSTTNADGTEVDLSALERVAVYGADFSWEQPSYTLTGFYRRGHYHWGDKGDIFGLYREANYGENLDIYNGAAPIGVELEGKGKLDGLAVAAGPQLWWGANPAVVVRYGQDVGASRLTFTHQEDLAQRADTSTLTVMPSIRTRTSTLALETGKGPLGVQLGGIFGGTPRLGQSFRYTVPADEGTQSYADSGYHVLQDEIRMIDTLGGRARVTYEKGNFHAFAQGGYRGLVADTGGDPNMLFTGWTLRESGSGNQVNAMGGMAWYLGRWMVGPQVLWQKPLVGPLPSVGSQYDAETGWYQPGLAPRNVLSDPFVVISNREMTAFELLLSWDPTPGTWMWRWDGEYREDAPFAFSTNFVYRIQPTSRDAMLGFSDTGELFAFSASPEAANVWDWSARVWVQPGKLRILTKAYVGQGQSSGDDSRLVTRYGVQSDIGRGPGLVRLAVKVDDWGPYDYHRAFNLTYPLQLEAHASWGVARPPLEGTATRIGLEGRYRTLDDYSPDPELGLDNEWEIRSVLTVSL
ncbi:MAG: hypothetical protein VX899_22595 [Myxococcota bacterium]|nr:hypothetical protein [Myxococcota bacterium]